MQLNSDSFPESLKDELNYDNMFHQFGIARLITNQYVLFEKIQVLNIQFVDKTYFKYTKSIIVLAYKQAIPFNFNNALKMFRIYWG